MGDAKSVNELPEFTALTGFECGDQVFGGLLGELIELKYLRFGQGVEVGLIFDSYHARRFVQSQQCRGFLCPYSRGCEVLERPLLADWVVFSDDAPCGLGRVALRIDAECF